jgi:hypothetical protein
MSKDFLVSVSRKISTHGSNFDKVYLYFTAWNVMCLSVFLIRYSYLHEYSRNGEGQIEDITYVCPSPAISDIRTVLWAHYAYPKSVVILNEWRGHGRRWGRRSTQARIWILRSFSATVHEWPSKHKSWNIWFGWNLGREPRNKQRNWLQFGLVLGTTLYVSLNYNGLLCAHYLPANRADSLVDRSLKVRESRSLAK